MIDICVQKVESRQTSLRKMAPLEDNSKKNNRNEEKYGLRPRTIIKRLQQERTRQEVPKKIVRSKSRPAPLSKYRRKTANARERHRMKEINNAFDTLRKALPDTIEVPTTQSSMTKITTLRLAVNYIRALSEVLNAEDDVADLRSIQNSLQNSIQDSLQDCLDQSFQYSIHHSFQKSVPEANKMATIQYDPSHHVYHPYHAHHMLQQHHPQLMDICSLSTSISASSSPSTNRGSLSSTSDLEELLSDDSGLLEDNIDVFHDIPTFCVADTFDILLGAEKDGISFTHELCC